jgi:diacylglycerol kinase (ATP)
MVNSFSPKEGRKDLLSRLKRVLKAARYTWQGLCHAWKREAAFQEEVLVGLPLILISLLLTVSASERALLISSVLLVFIVELLNSAVETLVDLVSPEYHHLAGIAKDIASAAVGIAVILTLCTWGCILL